MCVCLQTTQEILMMTFQEGVNRDWIGYWRFAAKYVPILALEGGYCDVNICVYEGISIIPISSKVVTTPKCDNMT